MSPTLDTALTIGGFILGAAVVVFLVPWGLYMSAASTADGTQDQPPSRLLNTAGAPPQRRPLPATQ
jgi:hypothetical protein